jgi:hypothetical protein
VEARFKRVSVVKGALAAAVLFEILTYIWPPIPTLPTSAAMAPCWRHRGAHGLDLLLRHHYGVGAEVVAFGAIDEAKAQHEEVGPEPKRASRSTPCYATSPSRHNDSTTRHESKLQLNASQRRHPDTLKYAENDTALPAGKLDDRGGSTRRLGRRRMAWLCHRHGIGPGIDSACFSSLPSVLGSVFVIVMENQTGRASKAALTRTTSMAPCWLWSTRRAVFQSTLDASQRAELYLAGSGLEPGDHH